MATKACPALRSNQTKMPLFSQACTYANAALRGPRNSIRRRTSCKICDNMRVHRLTNFRRHESKKQYICAYCPNHFRTKNEVERHQNSLHLRRHSWSCAALDGPGAGLHLSITHAGGADTCGYCGKKFAENPPQWEERAKHMIQVHRFGECDKAKKLFRADHFRQHLKHIHAGVSGEWTNLLENSCMKDEPLPEKRVAASNQESAQRQVNHTTGLLAVLFQVLVRWCRPKLRKNHARLEWHCQCGQQFWGDFESDEPEKLHRLADELQQHGFAVDTTIKSTTTSGISSTTGTTASP